MEQNKNFHDGRGQPDTFRYLDFSIGSDAILEEVCQLIHRCIKEQKGSPDIDKAITELLDIF